MSTIGAMSVGEAFTLTDVIMRAARAQGWELDPGTLTHVFGSATRVDPMKPLRRPAGVDERLRDLDN